MICMEIGERKPEDEELPPIAERRAASRRAVLLEGKAVHEFDRHAIPCQVRNLTDCGAKIAISNHHFLPQKLTFTILRDNHTFQANVIWRRGDQAGLAFLDDNRGNSTSMSDFWLPRAKKR